MLFSLLLTSFLTLVELNCENLFDTAHDPSKQDYEFLPDGSRRWTPAKYWGKINRIGQEILSCSDDIPDLVALVEVENDSVLFDLTRRSLLRNAGYDYLMTTSSDLRGLDVALLYQPSRFRPLCYETFEVPQLKGMRPTRDILYVKGLCQTGDTLHVFVVHAPSRWGGVRHTRPYRMQVSKVLEGAVNSIGLQSLLLVAGDFNDYHTSRSLRALYKSGLVNVSAGARGSHGAKGTYRYQGQWQSIDHVLASHKLRDMIDTVYIHDAPFLLDEDPLYGGNKPYRSVGGRSHSDGFSDHLPLVVRFCMEK